MLTLLILVILSFGSIETINGQFLSLLHLPNNPMKAYLEVPDFIGLAKEHGLVAEKYTVKTEDGCTLHLHRLIKQGADSTKVVFLQHGLLESSEFFILFKNRSLGLALLDEGYDLWFGNCRGNLHGSCDSKVLKNSSLEELALYDLKSSLDTVLNVTNQKSLIYVGHSMGGAIIHILLSQKPEYNSCIKLIINLAPALFFAKNHSPLAVVVRTLGPTVTDLLLKFGFYRFLPKTAFLNFIATAVCGNFMLTKVCEIVAQNPVSTNQLKKYDISKVLSYFPVGVPTRVARHFSQLFLTANGTFKAYDWGSEGNLKQYGQSTPRLYDLKKITVKTVIFGGDKDVAVNFHDLDMLKDQLPNVIHFEILKDFKHLDYFTSMKLDEVLNQKILKLIKQ